MSPHLINSQDGKSRKPLLTSSHTEQHPKDFAEQGPEPDDSWHLHAIQIALDLRDSRTRCHWLSGKEAHKQMNNPLCCLHPTSQETKQGHPLSSSQHPLLRTCSTTDARLQPDLCLSVLTGSCMCI